MKDDARKAVAKLLNQKYLGFLEWILHEITEFIELACGPNLKGEVSAQKKQWIANLMAKSAVERALAFEFGASSKQLPFNSW